LNNIIFILLNFSAVGIIFNGVEF